MTILANTEAWHVAVLTMMAPAELGILLSGDRAEVWVKAAAAYGIPEAQLRLGRMLLDGNRMPLNRQAAFENFRQAARQKNAEACNMLGRCYENGWGTGVDYAAAARQYRMAAEAGLDWGQYNFAHMLLSGGGVAPDRQAAFLWYGRAAAQGHARAMNLVARCLEQGWGVTTDVHAARLWYRRSAMGGYFRGAYNYGMVLAEDGCLLGAIHWLNAALAKAPELTRCHMIAALIHHKQLAIRDFILRPSAPCVGGDRHSGSKKDE